MNEGLFGQYSVFCVFGSVVGCVVVPLVAQVLQQQSMECMILSAIVLSLTAAHLNKKCVTGHNPSKVNSSKEYDKRKFGNQTKRSKISNVTPPNNNSDQIIAKPLRKESKTYHENQLQKFEHLKIIEMEKRQEEKKLRKIQKREERLKKREEENRKQKEWEEKYKVIKEKRCKEQREKQSRQKSFGYDTFEKVKPAEWNKTLRSYGFSRNAIQNSSSSYRPKTNNGMNFMSKNITASCSSLSSISSNESISVSPVPSSPPIPSSTSAWKKSTKSDEMKSCWKKLQPDIIETIGSQFDHCSKLFSDYSGGFSSIPCVSSSLFSSNHEHSNEKDAHATTDTVAEYKLFGPQKGDKHSLSGSLF